MIDKVVSGKYTYRSCFDGYLCPECASCIFWADGTNDRGIGCARPYATCENQNRVCLLDEIRHGNINTLVSDKHGNGTPLAVDMDSISANVLVQYEDGTKRWENVSNLNRG